MSPILRLDYLGAGHPLWKANAAIAAIPQGASICVLDDPDTFGRCVMFLRRVLRERPDVQAVFSHLHWDKDHRIIPLKKLKRLLPDYHALSLDFPGRSIFVSHSLEYSEQSRQAVQQRIDLVLKLAPHTKPINCCYKGATIPGIPTERHGGSDLVVQPGDILSTDGAAKGLGAPDCNMPRIVAQNSRALAVAAWAPRFNFRQSPPDANTPPPPYLKRKAAPSPRYFRDLAALLEPPGSAPKSSFISAEKLLDFKRPELWKIFAEDESNPDGSLKFDPRACLPLFICRNDAPFAKMLTHDGQLVGKLSKYGPYSHGGFRYYSGHRGGAKMSSSEIARRASELSSSPWIFLECGGNVWRGIHPAHRWPYFQG